MCRVVAHANIDIAIAIDIGQDRAVGAIGTGAKILCRTKVALALVEIDDILLARIAHGNIEIAICIHVAQGQTQRIVRARAKCALVVGKLRRPRTGRGVKLPDPPPGQRNARLVLLTNRSAGGKYSLHDLARLKIGTRIKG